MNSQFISVLFPTPLIKWKSLVLLETDTNDPHFDETVRLLQEEISMGLIGVRKITEVNGLLKVYWRGEEGWPKEVRFYQAQAMLVFSIWNRKPHVATEKSIFRIILELTDAFWSTNHTKEILALILEHECEMTCNQRLHFWRLSVLILFLKEWEWAKQLSS